MHCGRVSDIFGKGICVSRIEACLLVLHDHTALAEAEVEYEDHTSPSIWVKFPVVGDAAAEKLGAGVDAVIWTTTPWTLPHNRALAFHPDYEYVVAETAQGALLVAADRVGVAGIGHWNFCYGRARTVEGKRTRRNVISASVSKDLRVPAVLGRLRHARSGNWNRAHRAGTRRGGFSDWSAIWAGDVCAAG